MLSKSKVFIHTKAVEKYWKSRNLTQLRAWTSRPHHLPQNYLTTKSDTTFYINIQYSFRMKQFHSLMSTFQKKSSQTWPSSTIASCTNAVWSPVSLNVFTQQVGLVKVSNLFYLEILLGMKVIVKVTNLSFRNSYKARKWKWKWATFSLGKSYKSWLARTLASWTGAMLGRRRKALRSCDSFTLATWEAGGYYLLVCVISFFWRTSSKDLFVLFLTFDWNYITYSNWQTLGS